MLDVEIEAEFATGYPHIGLSNDTFDKVARILEQDIRGMNCTKGMHWGICRVKGQSCNTLHLDYDIVVTMNEYEFSIPLKNIAVYVDQPEHGKPAYYCSMQIAALSQSRNSLVLGSAFFTAFLGIFDVENDRLGLAESIRALPGNSITCVGKSCKQHNPIGPSHSGDEKLMERIKIAVIILGVVVLGVAICFVFVWCKNRSEKREEIKRVTRRASMGMKGYDL